MPDLINIKEEPVKSLLPILLQDKTTKKNIIWATDIYSDLGPGYSDKNQLTTELLLGRFTLQPRITKSLEEQQQRTRTKAEVMTPVWICNKMNNYLDEQWFGRCDVFNHENEDHTWEVTEGSIAFEANSWQSYVDSRRLEITCGEAPYLVSRYDTTTGELISPLSRRIGILDRKLRIVNENTETEDEWVTWAERAIASSYGYEYQGDNLLIARINILLTYWEYYLERWKKEPPKNILQHIGTIIAWNIWQMDGLKDTVPLGKPFEEYHQISMLDLFSETDTVETEMTLPCQIRNWREKSSVLFMDCKRRRKTMRKNLFDFVIGNPPYQDTGIGENSKTPSVYNHFLDEAYTMADVVEMIHPARFLFNAGDTDKKWNQKMLNDPHFRVLLYEPISANIFSNTDIKGGVAITYRDVNSNYEPIGIFFKQPFMNSIFHKIVRDAFQPFSNLVFSPVSFKFTEKMHEEHPNLKNKLSNGNEYEVKTNVFETIPEVFFDRMPNDGVDYIKILGRINGERVYKFIRRDYIENKTNLDTYKAVMPEATGIGAFGEMIFPPHVEGPGVGFTQTFITIGKFASYDEALAVTKYIKTKFCRAMLGTLKVTQHTSIAAWHNVPLQDFSQHSDITWSDSIANIDKQLYRKYKLSAEEIAFIEKEVKEMI